VNTIRPLADEVVVAVVTEMLALGLPWSTFEDLASRKTVDVFDRHPEVAQDGHGTRELHQAVCGAATWSLRERLVVNGRLADPARLLASAAFRAAIKSVTAHDGDAMVTALPGVVLEHVRRHPELALLASGTAVRDAPGFADATLPDEMPWARADAATVRSLLQDLHDDALVHVLGFLESEDEEADEAA
jgi:hypothetical protein